MKSPPVFFNRQHAEVIVKKWYEVCGELHWFLFALAVMPAHVHVVLAAQNGQGIIKLSVSFLKYSCYSCSVFLEMIV
jgi:REP element-mobilizing transposase RayT